MEAAGAGGSRAFSRVFFVHDHPGESPVLRLAHDDGGRGCLGFSRGGLALRGSARVPELQGLCISARTAHVPSAVRPRASREVRDALGSARVPRGTAAVAPQGAAPAAAALPAVRGASPGKEGDRQTGCTAWRSRLNSLLVSDPMCPCPAQACWSCRRRTRCPSSPRRAESGEPASAA